MNEWWTTIGFWLVDFVVMATILLAVAMGLRSLLRNPGGRVLVAWGAWIGIIAAAVVTTVPSWPRSNVTGVLGLSRSAMHFATPEVPQTTSLVIVDALQHELEPQITVRSAEEALARTWSWPQMLAAAWLTVGAAAGVWIGIGWWQVRQIVRQSMPAPAWAKEEFGRIAKARESAVGLRVNGRLTSVVATGVMRPVILLPQESTIEANQPAIQAALAHEWAHIRNGDLWLLALERLVMPLLAAHPLFWLLRKSTRLDQELLADAAAAGDKPVEYAEALVTWAKAAAPACSGWAVLAMSDDSNNLYRRIDMILNRKRPLATRLGTFCACAAVCCLLGLIGGLSLVTLRPLEAEDEAGTRFINLTDVEPATIESPAEPAVAPAESEDVESPPASTKPRSVITLAITLMAHDYDRATYDKIKSVANLERIAFRMQGTERHVLKAELDEPKAVTVIGQLQTQDGIRMLCRSSIIALSGQQALIEVREPGPQVEVEENVSGTFYLRKALQDIPHRVVVTPRVTEDPNRLEVTVQGGWLKQTVGVGKTLMLVSTAENEILFVTPTKVGVQTSSPDSYGTVYSHPVAPSTAAPAMPVPPAAQASPYQLLPAWVGPAQPTAPRAPRATTPPAAAAPAAVQAGGTQRKLLELDLADAKLNVEAMETELQELQEILKKNPGAASSQELRKRKLQVERAKIQVQRIMVQLEEASKPSEPKAQPTGTVPIVPMPTVPGVTY